MVLVRNNLFERYNIYNNLILTNVEPRTITKYNYALLNYDFETNIFSTMSVRRWMP